MPIDYHKHEDDYFLKQDAERRAKLRAELQRKAEAARLKGELAATMNIDDEAIVERAQELGFDGETAKVLHLIPLVHVAWADGSVTPRERLTILQAAEAHGAAPGSEAETFLASLLESRPDDGWLQSAHDLLRAIAHKIGSKADDIVQLCNDVARASGGFLGVGPKISDDEQALIAKFAEMLKDQSRRETKSLVE